MRIRFRRYTSIDEAASMVLNDLNRFKVTGFFKYFYNGFSQESVIWFAYFDEHNDYENPIKFRFDDWKDTEYSVESLRTAITPGILPANFASGRS